MDPGAIKHLVKMIYHYLFLCHVQCLYAVGYLFLPVAILDLSEFLLSHLKADGCGQAHAFFSILLFP